ncbi:hypothetical protein CJF42_00225 [Pseudoalteromonas sp. NBT06-2]|uniref:GumC family protein n=1 Tax=Pseudoalteromonas sp. NBT06-2 TaxID=2025950 RepID=UPI000BA606C5|nr:polysaccharide biosynthesis tyrosine autokinase [Pseudoalteromonas sp. NBT06-2]PAJ76363.1 hypothetical protein CJF42_00225 [Pseudoalteromonas sp. NBT06-2]
MLQQESNFKPIDDEIDLSDLISLFWMKKWFILIVTFSTFVAGFVVIDEMPEVYTASTTVMVKGDKASNPLQSIMSGASSSNEELDTTIKLLKSKQFAKEIILLLDDTSALLHASSQQKWDEVQLLKNLKISTVSRTNMLEISYESEFPSFTALVVNTIANNFVSYQANLMRHDNEKSGDWINSKIEDVKNKLLQEEDNLKQYRAKNNVVDITSLVELSKLEISQLYKELRLLKLEHEKLNRIGNKLLFANSNHEQIMNIFEVANSKMIILLTQQESTQQAKLSQIKLRYLHKHPKYQAIENKIFDTKAQIKSEIKTVINKYTIRMDEVEHLIKAINLKIQKANEKLELAITKRINFDKIKRNIDANIALLASITAKQKEAELLNDINRGGGIIVVDPAVTPRHPIKPKKALLSVLSLVMGFMLSVLLVIILHFFADAHRKFRQIAHHYGYKVIGEIPKVKRRGKNKSLPIISGNGKQFEIYEECIRSIRTKIYLDRELNKQKLIAVSSLTPNEGKSSTCLQLAKSFSELENVIIIDADLRDPSIAVALNEPRHRPGLTNILAQTHTFDECIFKDENINVDVLASGLRPMNPLLFLSMKRFENLLKALQNKYDRVILECPPILSVSDALMISKHVGGLILVVDIQKNSVAKVNHDLELLNQSDTKINGVILNRVKYDKQNYYYGSTKRAY